MRSTNQTTENFPPGISAEVWKVVFHYSNNQITKQSCFNKVGLEVLPSGEPMPPLPEGLPSASFFSAKGNFWEHGELYRETETSKPLKTGNWKYWTKEGVLFQEVSYDKGVLNGTTKNYNKANGILILEEPYLQGKKHGKIRKFNTETGDLISEEEFANGKECGIKKIKLDDGELAYPGTWEGSGEVLGSKKIGLWTYRATSTISDPFKQFQFDYGIECLASDIQAAGLMNFDSHSEQLTAEKLLACATENIKLRKFANALFCHIRAAILSDSRGELAAFLKAYTFPLAFSRAYGDAEGCGKVWSRLPFNYDEPKNSTAVYLLLYLNQIIAGAAPEKMLQQAAIYFDQNGQHEIALELIQTSLMLAPERVDFGFNAGLVAMSLGLTEKVRGFAQLLDKKEVDLHDYLNKYTSMVFTPIIFENPKNSLHGYKLSNSQFGEHEVKITASLETIQSKIKNSLGWLTVMRQILINKMHFSLKVNLEQINWLPADYSAVVGEEIMKTQWAESHRVENLAIPDVLKEVKMMQEFVEKICWMVGLEKIDIPVEIQERSELKYFVPEAFGRSCFLEDYKKDQKSPMPEFTYNQLPVSYWPKETVTFLESYLRGLTGAIQFLCADPVTRKSPIEFSFFDKFYNAQPAHWGVA